MNPRFLRSEPNGRAKISHSGLVRFNPAYSGGFLYTDDYDCPSVVDLSTLRIESDIPILLEHRRDHPVGIVTDVRIDNNQIFATGKIADQQDLLHPEDWSYLQKWKRICKPKPSIGVFYRFDAPSDSGVHIGYGERVEVNGRTFEGEFELVRNASLTEISLVVLAGDPQAQAVLAKRGSFWRGVLMKTWEDFLTEQGLTPEAFDALSEEEKALLNDQFNALNVDNTTAVEAETSEPSPDAGLPLPSEELIDAVAGLADAMSDVAAGEGDAIRVKEVSDDIAEAITDEVMLAIEETPVETVTAEVCDEKDKDKKSVEASAKRLAIKKAVRAKLAKYPLVSTSSSTRKKVSGNTTAVKAAVVKRCVEQWRRNVSTMRPSVRAGLKNPFSGEQNKWDILLAQYASSMGLSDDAIANYVFHSGDPSKAGIFKERGERAVNASIATHRHGRGAISFKELVDRSLRLQGLPGITLSESNSSITERMYAAKKPAVRASVGGFSTFDALGALELVMNAKLMDRLKTLNPVHEKIVTNYDVDGTSPEKFVDVDLIGKLETATPTGQFANLTMEDSSFEIQTSYKGAVLSVPVANMLNDKNLHAVARAMEQAGEIAIGTKESDFWAQVRGTIAGTYKDIKGETFFSTSHGNLLTGTSYALSNGETAIDAANELFDLMQNANGQFLTNDSSMLLTGSKNFYQAKRLLESDINYQSTVGSKMLWFGKYECLGVPQLTSGAGSGGSDTQWLLLSKSRPFIGCANLNGWNAPQIDRQDDVDLRQWKMNLRVIYFYKFYSMRPESAVLVTGAAS